MPGNSSPSAKLLLSPREAAAALSISERTLATLTAQGQVPSVKIGHARRYSPTALAAWIAAEESRQTNPQTLPLTAASA